MTSSQSSSSSPPQLSDTEDHSSSPPPVILFAALPTHLSHNNHSSMDVGRAPDLFFTQQSSLFSQQNSIEGGLVCDSSPPLPLTKEAVMSLNNHSVTFEQARSMFHVDLPTFKAKLLEFNILVWNEPNGKKLRIHAGDHGIFVVIDKLRPSYCVEGTWTLSDFQKMLERDLYLTPGSYELTYEDPQTSNYKSLKTDLDWHNAVQGSEGRFVRLNLEARDEHIAIFKAAYDDFSFLDECSDEDEYADEFAAADEYAAPSHLATLNLG